MNIVYNRGICCGEWIGVRCGQYEYICVTHPNYQDALGNKLTDELEKAGWRRGWADMQIDGAFVVYRRECVNK